MTTSAATPTTTQQPTPRERSIVDRAWDAQERLENRVSMIGRGKYGRVIRMARKPTPDEFNKSMIVSGLGILLIGAVGFVVYLIFSNLEKALGI